MSSAQKAKIRQLQEQNGQLEARIVHLNASLAEARTPRTPSANPARACDARLRGARRDVNDAIESREAAVERRQARAVNEAADGARRGEGTDAEDARGARGGRALMLGGGTIAHRRLVRTPHSR